MTHRGAAGLSRAGHGSPESGVAHQSATEFGGFGVTRQVMAWLLRARLDPVGCGVVPTVRRGSIGLRRDSAGCSMAHRGAAWLSRLQHGS
jgi:hypothetical protein